jgi:hypothetical protein
MILQQWYQVPLYTGYRWMDSRGQICNSLKPTIKAPFSCTVPTTLRNSVSDYELDFGSRDNSLVGKSSKRFEDPRLSQNVESRSTVQLFKSTVDCSPSQNMPRVVYLIPTGQCYA